MDNKQLLLAIVAIAVIIGSVATTMTDQRAKVPQSNLKPFEYVGHVAAEETAKLLSGLGTVVVVKEVFEGIQNPQVESQVAGFRAEMAKLKGITLQETKEIRRQISDDPQQWSPGQAARLASFGAGGNALVFFGGLPQSISPEEVAALKETKVKLVVVCGSSPVLDSLVRDRAVHRAIVSRSPAKPATRATETPREWFDRVYLIAKPE